MDRRLYPNGNVGGYWDAKDIHSRFPQVVILHNNWIKGLRAKIERLVLRRLCLCVACLRESRHIVPLI